MEIKQSCGLAFRPRQSWWGQKRTATMVLIMNGRESLITGAIASYLTQALRPVVAVLT